jgi:hypothetical protein
LGLLVGRVYLPLTGLTNAWIDVLSALLSFYGVFVVFYAPCPLVYAPGAF